MVLSIEDAFRFVFRDKKWITKVLIGGIITIIPIANFIVLGYILRILKDAKNAE